METMTLNYVSAKSNCMFFYYDIPTD